MNTKPRNFTYLVLALAIGAAGGYWLGDRDSSVESSGPGELPAAAAKKEVLYWVAPMDPNYRRDQPGKSPMGMDLVPVYADEAGNGSSVHINPAVAQNLGVRTSTAIRRSLWRKVEATGYIAYDETQVRQINLRTEGWIERLLVQNEGEHVTKGQLLFEFYSPQLLNSQKEYVQAKRRGDEGLIAAGREKLLALGMESADLQQLDRSGKVTTTVQVLAPQDGTVTRLNVKEGVFVQPSTEVMTLADLSSVWLKAGVFESQADWVTVAQSAEARLNYLPGEVFNGRVDYVYPVLDPVSRTLQVRLRFENPGERLKPNMYARVSIFGKSHPGALSIPREALIRGEKADRVVVALGNGHYSVHEVISGVESGDWVEILSGLEAGDEVVTSAQFLIDSEASLAGSIQRLDSDQAMRENRAENVFASGRIEALNVETRRMRLSHGPIQDLGWGAMTMEFDVLPGVDLGALRVGQDIQFELGQSDVGDYQIRIIRRDSPTTPGEHDQAHEPEDAP